MARSAQDQRLIDSLKQQLTIANRVKNAAIDCTKSWDNITDELIWEREEVATPGGDPLPIDDDRLQTFIARFPHYTRELQDYVERWNRGRERALTTSERAALDLSPGEPQSAAAALRTLRWAQRLDATQKQSEARGLALAEVARALMAGALTPSRVAELLIVIHNALAQKGAPK